MGGPLSVTFSDIYKVKMKNDALIPSNTIFYHRFVYSIYSRRKLGDNALFDQWNSYHPNIKLTIEVKPGKFLDKKIININGAYKFNVYRKNKHLHNGPSKLQNAIKEIQSMVIFIVQKEYHQNLKKSLWIPPNLLTKFHKVTNYSFRMVVTWKTRN